MKWLMLLQQPIHPEKLQGPMVEELILSSEGWLRSEQGPEERQQGGPSGSLAARCWHGSELWKPR